MIYCPYLEKGAGRLGNQMFQIAGTLGVAYKNNTIPCFDSWTYTDYFSVPGSWFGRRGDDVSNYVDLPEATKPYLQDISLWKENITEVRKIFRPSAYGSEVIKWQSAFMDDLVKPICSVHVRRGDNVTNEPNTINLLSMKYYVDALFSLNNVGSVVVFSDDPVWCKANLDADYFYEGIPRPKENGDHYFDDNPMDWIDLMLMAKCDYHIISNSSYAWWGAFLSKEYAPIYPSYWCGKRVLNKGFDPSLLFPKSWRIIKC